MTPRSDHDEDMSMEEILASIRRFVTDNPSGQPDAWKGEQKGRPNSKQGNNTANTGNAASPLSSPHSVTQPLPQPSQASPYRNVKETQMQPGFYPGYRPEPLFSQPNPGYAPQTPQGEQAGGRDSGASGISSSPAGHVPQGGVHGGEENFTHLGPKLAPEQEPAATLSAGLSAGLSPNLSTGLAGYRQAYPEWEGQQAAQREQGEGYATAPGLPQRDSEDSILTLTNPIGLNKEGRAKRPQPIFPAPKGESLGSAQTVVSSAGSLARLAQTAKSVPTAHVPLTGALQRNMTLDQLIQDMIRPMIKQWIDNHLPSLVEEMVAKEIRRITQHLE